MNRPRGRKSSLSKEHPATPAGVAPAVPADAKTQPTPKKKPAAARTKISFYTTPETAGQVRAALAHVPAAAHGYRNVSELIEAAVNEKVRQLQEAYNQGQAWPAADPGTVSRGRPVE